MTTTTSPRRTTTTLGSRSGVHKQSEIYTVNRSIEYGQSATCYGRHWCWR